MSDSVFTLLIVLPLALLMVLGTLLCLAAVIVGSRADQITEETYRTTIKMPPSTTGKAATTDAEEKAATDHATQKKEKTNDNS